MSDFFAPAIPAEQVLSHHLRVHPVEGDCMEPTLRGNWDYVLLCPVNTYKGEGIYLIDDVGGGSLYRVSPAWDGKKGLHLSRDNKRYVDHTLSLEKFEEIVLGIVVADVKVRDERFLREATM